MYPFGVVLRRHFGYSLNVYGQLVANAFFRLLALPAGAAGAQVAPPWALHVQHLVIGWTLAVPLTLLVERRGAPHRVSTRVLVGGAYGAAAWLVVNSLVLPITFGRPTPWTVGFAAIWPSLLVHLVYGVTTALVCTAMVGRPLPKVVRARPS
jgi:uncharacterized membrane protein YagU involved in acid resistance